MNPQNSLPSVKGSQPIPSSAGLQSELISIDQGKICEKNINRLIKIKRRKTKKERNINKFKTQETFQKKGWPQNYVQRRDGSSNTHGPKIAPHPLVNKPFISKQVFITQDRLIQHQGIFDHEVKSVNIKRFVKESMDVEAAKKDSATDNLRRTPMGHKELSLGLLLTPEGKDQEEIPSNPKSSEPLSSRAADRGKTGTQVPQPEPNVGVDKKISTLVIQGSGSRHQSPLSGGRTGTFPEELQEAPVHEAAESINNMLNLRNLFPGRNLVSEIRQSIMEKVKELSGTRSNLSSQSVERKPDFICRVDTSAKYKFGHGSGSGTDVRKTTQRPQGPMQSTPFRFMHLPRDSPDHMVRPEQGHQIPKQVLHEPVKSRYDLPLQQHSILAENSPHLVTVQLPSEGFRPNRQDKDVLTHYRECRHRPNTHSPQVRWTIARDDLGYSQNTNKTNIKWDGSQKMIDQGWLPGKPFQDISTEHSNISEPRFRSSSSRENQPSFEVLHNLFGRNVHHSPITEIFGVPPIESRACHTGISSHQLKFRKSFESHHIRPEKHGVKVDRFQDPLEFKRIKNYMSSPLETDMDSAHDIFCNRSSQKQRNISSDHRLLSSSPSLREATGVVGKLDTEWHSEDSWPHRTSHQYSQWTKRPIVMPSTSAQQGNSFVSHSYGRTQDPASPETWVFPRMKLY
ncbi:proline-rich protein 19 [Pyxicephalus adspersus]|uniref:Uncharacterized protein n=1 Tax=Pyxicephalus adspersus TaxID=30357 RepID=A0AAV3A175_PYXAD|nr:TPA: hypothetical protein GDO54_003334 [Pyxicephalus adspersus]